MLLFLFLRPLINKKNFNFSFSGLKTAMLRFLEKNPEKLIRENSTHSQKIEGPIFASFFKSVTDVLIHKTFSAAKKYNLKNISVSGGLAASLKLRSEFEEESIKRGTTLFYPPPRLCTDNAAMVVCLAAHRFEQGQYDDLNLDAYPNLI